MHPDAPTGRITIWLAILGYSLVASGLPLPLGGVAPSAVRDAASAKRLSTKDRSRPFPCMDKPCGCDSADRCFTNCCCHAPAETLAWARAHGVEPSVLLALGRRVVAAAASPREGASCCTSQEPRRQAESTCCESTDEQCRRGWEVRDDVRIIAAAAAIPAGRMQDASSPAGSADRWGGDAAKSPALTAEPGMGEEGEPRQQRMVSLSALLACGGIVAEWCVTGAALPPPRVEVVIAMHLVEERLAADVVGAGLRAAPAAPPPRMA